MDADEFKAIERRLADMSERCDYVISRNRPLTLDVPPPRRPEVKPPIKFVPAPQQHVVASGELTGNEMRRPSGYSPQPSERDDCDPDGMWARFETEFDEMVQAHRA